VNRQHYRLLEIERCRDSEVGTHVLEGEVFEMIREIIALSRKARRLQCTGERLSDQRSRRIGIVAQEDRRGYAEVRSAGDRAVTLTTILLIILILILIGVIPTWPHSRDWGIPG